MVSLEITEHKTKHKVDGVGVLLMFRRNPETVMLPVFVDTLFLISYTFL